ncbi:TOBE domain-containing protein [Microvirga puerhi]|uniref:TOBE domain-containing protein n=1 Tax=Microvirga puerhi TaxID=2876078 RepID=A0ABS7VR72_9HYPH|nr:TOBE domain-containing protein [Microvirga puerhi]MBZ6078058.1 TOBE domain-containing protein [Microvirga puerhi]
MAAGTKLTLSIRPEDVVVSSDTKHGGLAVSIDLIEELGSSRVAYCPVGPQELAVELPRNAENFDHRTICLECPARRLHAFDRETGKRLAGPPQIVDLRQEPLVA